MRIPQAYWKLVAYQARDGQLTAAAFVLSQKELLDDLGPREMDWGEFRVYQEPLSDLKKNTGLNFDAYDGSEVLENQQRIAIGAGRLRLVEHFVPRRRQIRKPRRLSVLGYPAYGRSRLASPVAGAGISEIIVVPLLVM